MTGRTLTNNTVEQAVKPVAIGRKNWMSAGSERGGKAMVIAFTLIETAKLSGITSQASDDKGAYNYCRAINSSNSFSAIF